jgi:hypothetical protein
MKEKWKDSSLPLLILCLLLVLALWACPNPGTKQTTAGETTSNADEADRTRRMEEKAAEIRRMEEEIRTMGGSEQDKIDAVNRLDEARRELNDMQDDSGSDSR